ncbi:leucine-rich repeat domain-containing protein [Hymenobacter gummosus]|uniref:Leucine-rich repeat domain-containing protein n=1 Tax=Hymenobacter gummosus TaxID=1776032 RepID=A0A431TYD6_9BACT|nr:leucine-rich repeat domain-containing protein [Hymenobacter gummosus]RTQ46754.1 leucine-rich repeat domain-containing protein [Hymenobacter gummosus]
MASGWRRYWMLVVLALLLAGCKPLKRFAQRTFPRRHTYTTSEESARYLRRADVVGGTELDTGRFEVLQFRKQLRSTAVSSYPFHVGFGRYEQELFVRCRQLADIPVGQPLPVPHPSFTLSGYDSHGLFRHLTGTVTRLSSPATQPRLQFDLRYTDKQNWPHALRATYTFSLDSASAGPVGKDQQGHYTNLRLALKEPAKVKTLDLVDYAVQQHLIYGDASPFDTLYARLGELVNVEEMNLHLSHLDELPWQGLPKLKRLRKLDLHATGLTRFPPALLALDSLRELNLEWNHLDSIPADIQRMKGLRVLNLTSNRLGRYPEALNSLTGLRELYLGNASLRTLPGSIGRLRNLEVLGLTGLYANGNHHNQLTSLDALSELPKLRRLDLSGAIAGKLPEAVYQLPRLAELDISRTGLDSTAVDRRRLPTLKKLVWH